MKGFKLKMCNERLGACSQVNFILVVRDLQNCKVVTFYVFADLQMEGVTARCYVQTFEILTLIVFLCSLT